MEATNKSRGGEDLSAEISAKEDRKHEEFMAMKAEQRERAAAWTPEEAARQAQQDAAAFREEADRSERFYKASDMTANADANPHYREALDKNAPDVSKAVATEIESDKTVVINPTAGKEDGPGAPVPESWSGPAAVAFDREMGVRLGDPNYNRAQEMVSALNHYAEMSFEPSKREAAILASQKDAIAESRSWISENVLSNPTIKALMYETVRDYGRDSGDPHHDSERRAYLAEMSRIMESKSSASQPSVGDPLEIEPADMARVAAIRARDTVQAREALGLNTVEPNIEKEQQQLSEAQDAQRAAWLKKAEAEAPKPQPGNAPGDNKVESDEIFTATQRDMKPAVPPDVEKQYLHVGNKFYHPKNTDMVAFEDKGNKLETKSNSEAIAESMVRIAEARGWDEIKVSGSETFRKEAWLEGAARGMHVKGYSPSEQDKVELAKRMSQTDANKVEKGDTQFRARETDEAKAQPESPNKRMAESFAKDSPEEAAKKHPELAGAAAAVASMEKKAEADGLSAQQRAIVMARVRQNVVNSIERGNIPEVKVKEEVEVRREVEAEKEHAR